MTSTREHILKSAIKGVRQYGFEGIRIQNISELAGLTQGAIYRHFSTKNELMEECFYYVDKEVASIFDDIQISPHSVLTDPKSAMKSLWSPFFRYWTTHPDESVFYHRFRDSSLFPEFKRSKENTHFKSFFKNIDVFVAVVPRLKTANVNLLWIHILRNTVMYAKCIAEGLLQDTPETEEEIFRLILSGILGYLKNEDAVILEEASA